MKSYHRTFHSEFPVHDFTMTYKKSFTPMNSQYTLSDCEFTMKSHGHTHAAVTISRACSMRLLYRTHYQMCGTRLTRHSGSHRERSCKGGGARAHHRRGRWRCVAAGLLLVRRCQCAERAATAGRLRLCEGVATFKSGAVESAAGRAALQVDVDAPNEAVLAR